MVTAESVKAKLQGLITSANTITGKNDANLTNAMLSLAEGYRQGEPVPECKFKTMVDGSITEVTARDLQGISIIRNYAMSRLTNLTSIAIPDSVTSIGSYAFDGCSSLTSVVIPDSVTSIGVSAFQNCSNLTSIICYATTPPTLGSNAFSGMPDDCIIYVPEESVRAYKTATNWAARLYYIFPIGASMISFTVDNSVLPYFAEEGMTWTRWVNSSYNTYGGAIIGDYISVMDEAMVLTTDGATAYVTKDQEIIGGVNYRLVTSPLAIQFTVDMGNDTMPYRITSNKSWETLITESFEGGLYVNDGGYVKCQYPEGYLYKDSAKVPVTYQIQNDDVFTVGS